MTFSGPLLDRTLILALGAVVAVIAFTIARLSPKFASAGWIAVVAFVPIWLGVGLGFGGNLFVPAVSILGAVAIVALLPVRGLRLSPVDAVFALLVIASLSAVLLDDSGRATSFAVTLATQSVVGYTLGRLAPMRVDARWIYGAIALIFTGVAVLAIIEFVTGWNVFSTLSAGNSQFAQWRGLQERGDIVRAEGAFGHSIALGSSLAAAIPLTLASRFAFWARGSMVTVMLVATAVSFSRIGIVGAILSLLLTVIFLPAILPRRAKVALTATVSVIGLALFPVVATVFDDAGTEASGSAAYRGDLLSLVPRMSLLGLSDAAHRTADGQVYFGSFRSIDSQLILTGLSSGVIPLVGVLVALLAAVVLVVRRRATAATIAVVAQIPAFATVALITQYAIFVWFLIGLAATTQLQLRRRRDAAAHTVTGHTRVSSAEAKELQWTTHT